MAYCGKEIDKTPYRTYVLMGDGEAMEGNVWEAMTFAGFYKVCTEHSNCHSNVLNQPSLAGQLVRHHRREPLGSE